MMVIGSHASAQNVSAKLSKDAPIEIASDTLEVLQNEHKAIFIGNVIATQGNINMRAEKMTVFYREEQSGQPEEAEAVPQAALGKGIYRIESVGKVFFTTPEETAQGDTAIYNVDIDTIDLQNNVYLTRGKNVLKGTKLVYNLGTGRSVLTGGISSQPGGRVRGLFVPGKSAAPDASPIQGGAQ